MRVMKALVRRLLLQHDVARGVACLLLRVGAVHRSRRWAQRCGLPLPDQVVVPLPSHLFHSQQLTLALVEGRDQVAMRAFTHGWTSFEAPLPYFMAASLRDGDVVLDVGANTGYYALLAASVGEHIRVHAFEPLPSVAEMLEANVRANDQHRVVIVRKAVDREGGTADLYLPLADHGLVETSASLSSAFRAEHSSVVTVEKLTLDTYVRTAGLSRVDAIKIDVEGLEDRVLEGARQTLDVHRPLVFLEILVSHADRPADIRRLEAVRQASDYVAVQLTPEAIVCVPHVVGHARSLNQALWPRERLPALRALCKRHRLTLVLDPGAAA